MTLLVHLTNAAARLTLAALHTPPVTALLDRHTKRMAAGKRWPT